MSASLPTVRLRGHAFWAPGFDSLEHFVAGEVDDSVKKPPLAFVPSRMRRATSLATRMAVECAHRAVHAAGFDLANTATVFGSQHGEIQIAVDQMVMMEDGEGQISPARFKNSVHNTAAGLFSITAENKGFTTALAGGDFTFALSLLEGLALLKAGDATHLVVVCTDEALPTPIEGFSSHRDVSIAVAFSVEGDAGPALGLPTGRSETTPVGAVPSYLESHAAAAAFRLIEAARAGAKGALALDERWQVVLS